MVVAASLFRDVDLSNGNHSKMRAALERLWARSEGQALMEGRSHLSMNISTVSESNSVSRQIEMF